MSRNNALNSSKPSSAYVGGSYAVLLLGIVGFIVGLWNAEMALNEKGYYFTVLAFGLFSAVSLQKTVRDKQEGLRVSGTYFGLCYFAVGLSLLLLAVGLWNATLLLSEKGFYFMSFVLAMFAGITVQKNTRDIQASNERDTSLPASHSSYAEPSQDAGASLDEPGVNGSRTGQY